MIEKQIISISKLSNFFANRIFQSVEVEPGEGKGRGDEGRESKFWKCLVKAMFEGVGAMGGGE